MLREIQPPSIRSIFSLEMISSKIQYSKHSYSFKESAEYSYLCLKTQPLKFSIIMFQNSCLTNIRSFTLKTNQQKQIAFLNLQTQNVDSSQEEKYQIFVGYQTGEFDIYKIVGNNAKLIQASKQTQISRKQFIEVVYQPQYNQILIVNKNVLTSIQIKYPFRLKRQQDIKMINSCQISKFNNHLITAGSHRITIYEVNNFTKLKMIDIECSIIRVNNLFGGYFIGNNKQFGWINEQGDIKVSYKIQNSSINNITIVNQITYVIFNNGNFGYFQNKSFPSQIKTKKIPPHLQLNQSDVVITQSNQPKEDFKQQHLKSIESKQQQQQNNNQRQPSQLDNKNKSQYQRQTIKQQSFFEQIKQLKVQQEPKERYLTKIKQINGQQNIISSKIVGKIIVILNSQGIISIKQSVSQ